MMVVMVAISIRTTNNTKIAYNSTGCCSGMNIAKGRTIFLTKIP